MNGRLNRLRAAILRRPWTEPERETPLPPKTGICRCGSGFCAIHGSYDLDPQLEYLDQLQRSEVRRTARRIVRKKITADA